MKIHQITEILESWAPLHYAEDFDNVGLLVGSPNYGVDGILVTHDCLEEVVDEAIERNCNLIVCFHTYYNRFFKFLSEHFKLL